MASSSGNSTELKTVPTVVPDLKPSHTYTHNPDEFIDIHGSQSSNSLHTISQDSADALTKESDCSSNKLCDSKSCKETIDSFSHASSPQNSTLGLKLPVQESEGTKSGVIVASCESDDEYQSAEDGEGEYDSDDESDSFIPTADMLTNDKTTEDKDIDLVKARLSDDSAEADESDNGEEPPENIVVEEIDPLETRRQLEESLSTEEKQERKARSQQMKDEGNSKFRNGEYDEAILSYTAALDLCPLDCQKERSIMFANRAACKMKQECFEDAITDSSSALELHPHYLKAILRRAELYEKTDKLDEALKDYQKVVELDPSQHAARAACMKLAEQVKERNEKMKEEMIGKLKDLGDMVLRPFGLSVNNFNLQQDPNTGSYSVQFQQNAPGNGT